MGERGAANEAPTEVEIARMSAIVEEGLRAGALGFSTSRTILHKSVDGVLVPGTTATKEELIGIGRAMARAGHGVFEMASDLRREWDEFGWMGALSKETGLPVTFAMLQSIAKELPWQEQMTETARWNADGANIVAQIALRGNGILMAWRGTVHPFKFKPSWQAIDTAPWAEQWAKICDPAWKAQLLAEADVIPESDVRMLLMAVAQGFGLHYEMGEGFDYEPTQDQTVAARAAAAGISPAEYSYDLLTADAGTGFIYFPILNYADGNLDFVEGLLHRDDIVISLSDGGAHCGTICDAASPTFLLQHWVRDRKRGTITIENAIRRQCSDTARLYGLNDRGQLVPGMLADINLIDMAALRLGAPWMAFDLPAGGRRLLQRATGYRLTIKNGAVTFRDGTMTGALPGGLVRGPQAAPVVAMAAE